MSEKSNLIKHFNLEDIVAEIVNRKDLLQLWDRLAFEHTGTNHNLLEAVEKLDYAIRGVYPCIGCQFTDPNDDRKDFHQIDDENYWKEFFASSAGIKWNRNLVKDSKAVKGAFKSICAIIKPDKLKKLQDSKKRAELQFNQVVKKHPQFNRELCADEQFRRQAAFSWGTGFLVKSNIVVTAGHAVYDFAKRDLLNWQDMRIYFECNLTHPSQLYPKTKNKFGYKIEEILYHSKTNDNDFAVLRLAKDVKGVTPLPLTNATEPNFNSPIYTIGHCNGLPAKFIPGAEFLQRINTNFYATNLDTFSGNSGSPVINANTHKVEGILAGGRTDFRLELKSNCWASKKYKLADVYKYPYGERVQKISAVIPYL